MSGAAEPTDGARAPRVGAIVLAAGASTRAGATNKLLADFDGRPLVRYVVERTVALPLAPVTVVIGHQAARVRAAISDLPVRTVENGRFRSGIGTSIATGVTSSPPGLDGLLIVLADMPWLDADLIGKLLAELERNGPGAICVPVRDRRRGNPVLWGVDHFPALAELTGDVGGRNRMNELPERIVEVTVDRWDALDDIDTQTELEGARGRLRVRSLRDG